LLSTEYTVKVLIEDSLNEYSLTTAIKTLIEDSLNEYSLTSAIASLYPDTAEVVDTIQGMTFATGQITDQTITTSDIDTTASNFVFDDAYKVTSAESDSLLSTEYTVKLLIEDSLNEYSLSAALFDTAAVVDTIQGMTFATGQITDQTITKDDIDTTASNFVFDDAYRGTSAESDSAYTTQGELGDSATAIRGDFPAALSNQGVKGDHIDSTSENFVFDDAYKVTSAESDSLLSTEYTVKVLIEDSLNEYSLSAVLFDTAATVDTIQGVISDGGYITATLTEEEVEDFIGGMLGGTETGIAVTYEDGTNDIDFVAEVTQAEFDKIADDTTNFLTAFGWGDWSGMDFADVLGNDPDGGDVDQTSLGKLEFFDAGLYLDADADGVMLLSSDGTMSFNSTSTMVYTSDASIAFECGDGTVEITSDDWAISTTGTIINTAIDADNNAITNLGDGAIDNNITIDLATLATTLTITDNESTSENNPIVFVAGADPDGGSLGLESDGHLTYNPGTGTITAPIVIADSGLVTKNSDISSGFVVFWEDSDNGTDKLRLGGPQTIGGDVTLTLPSDDGDAGEQLQTDGSGNMSWESAGGSPSLEDIFNYMHPDVFDTTGFGDSVGIKAGTITVTHLGSNSVDSDELVNGGVDAGHLAADVIDETKIADDGINSEHYNDGSIDAVHLAADIIDETKIADNGIASEHYNDGSIDLVHIAAAAYAVDIVTTAPVTGATDNVLVGADADVTLALDFTASWDFGGAAGFEIPAVDDPTTNAEGEIAWDANDDAIEVYMGDEGESALLPIYQVKDFHIFAPDGIDDEICIFHVDALVYPFGIEIDQVSITLPADAAYSMVFEEWAGDPASAQNDISTVTTGGSDAYAEEAPDTDAAIDADDYIYLHVPSTEVDWIHGQIIFHVNDGN